MKRVLITILLSIVPIVGASWSPSENPNPQEILTSASLDRSQGNYADALKKHLWFHENALKIDRSFYGVRLSFALLYWTELSNVYPPAKKAYEEILQQAKLDSIKSDTCCLEAFNDYVSMNRSIDRERDTSEFFIWLDKNKPHLAANYFDHARPALILTKNYQTILKYFDSRLEMAKLKRKFKQNMQFAKSSSDEGEYEEFAINAFTIGAATLVALLVIGEDPEQAHSRADEALRVYDSARFKTQLENALNGVVPQPWP